LFPPLMPNYELPPEGRTTSISSDVGGIQPELIASGLRRSLQNELLHQSIPLFAGVMPMAIVTFSNDCTEVHPVPGIAIGWKIDIAPLTISTRDVPEHIKESQLSIFGLPLDVERYFIYRITGWRLRDDSAGPINELT